MKQHLLMAAFALLAASCGQELGNDVTASNESEKAQVTVHLTGFTATQEDFPTTRAAEDVAKYNGINTVTLAFYKADGTEAYKYERLKKDSTSYTTFGEFSLSLPMGSYTMVALAYYTSDGNPLVLTSPTAAEFTGKSFETFATTQAVTISNNDPVDISATLDRIIAQLKVVSTDGKTANVKNVRMTFTTGGKSFNPTTGLATVNTGFANTVGNSAKVGETSTSSSFLFLATDEQTMDVTIETLDADGNTLFSETVKNVLFKRNCVTKLTGAMYTNDALSGTFKLETAWLPEVEIPF